jgi:hypothetical protein
MANLSPQQATRQAMSAQWALSQLGAQNYYNLCQRFIENAYGTSGRYGSAAVAGNALMNNTSMEDADVGDLVFFRPDASNGGAGHVGIYLGDGEMVSATNKGITRDSLSSPYWKNLLVGFGDPPDQWQGRSDNALLQGAADLLSKGSVAVGDIGRAAAASPIAKWGGAGRWLPQIEAASERYGVPINLIAATMNAESGGDPNARSGAGAVGLMQLMPGTARGLGAADPTDPEQNIDAGVKYMAQLNDQFGDWGKVTQAYNAGPNGNWNNAETRNHLAKVMKMSNEIGSSISSGGGSGVPGSGFSGGGPNDPGRREPPEVTASRRGQSPPPNLQALGDLWAEFQKKFASTAGGGRAYNGPTNATPQTPQTPQTAPVQNPFTQGVTAQGAATEPQTSWGPPGSTSSPIAAPAAGAPGRPRSAGFTDPNTVPAAYRGIIGASNDLLEQMEAAKAEMAKHPAGSDEYFNASKSYDSYLQRWGQMAPSVAQIVQSAQKAGQGEFVPGTTGSQKKWTIVKQDPVTGAITTEVIDNPNPQDSDSLQASRESAAASRYGADVSAGASRFGAETAAGASRYGADVSRANALTAASSAENVANIGQETAWGTADIQSSTTRATAALQAAVQNQQTRLDAQIRSGELSLKEATEKWNQWYKTSVEAPLAILQQQRETERYKVEAQNAVTQRATGQSEHERGMANIGQQMWSGAAQAYNQMIPLTVGEGWGQGYQQNLAGNGYTPHEGATFNTPESLDQFATRKVAEMLKGVSPYAANIAGAQSAMGNPGQAMGGDQMNGLQQQATGVAQNALANPMQMPSMPQFQMPGNIDIAGMATAGSGSMNPGQIAMNLPDYDGFAGQAGSGYGLG